MRALGELLGGSWSSGVGCLLGVVLVGSVLSCRGRSIRSIVSVSGDDFRYLGVRFQAVLVISSISSSHPVIISSIHSPRSSPRLSTRVAGRFLACRFAACAARSFLPFIGLRRRLVISPRLGAYCPLAGSLCPSCRPRLRVSCLLRHRWYAVASSHRPLAPRPVLSIRRAGSGRFPCLLASVAMSSSSSRSAWIAH